MKTLKKYLEERHGVNSLMRLQSLLTLLFSFVIISIQIAKGTIYLELDILLISASFAPKTVQKFAEFADSNTEKLQDGKHNYTNNNHKRNTLNKRD